MITIRDLAKELKVPPIRIYQLVKGDHLKLLLSRKPFVLSLVESPSEEDMRWFRLLFAPLPKRPLWQMAEVIKLIKATEKEIRAICQTNGIQIYLDPGFGEMMTIEGFMALLESIHTKGGRGRFDRSALLSYMKRSKPWGKRWPDKPLPYGKSLEREINRIAGLEEPTRTQRAMELWSAYRDARTVAECLGKLRGRVQDQIQSQQERLQQLVDSILT